MSDTAHSSDEDYAAMDRWADELEAAEAAGRQVDPDDEDRRGHHRRSPAR
jgi:hypothetical protein